MFELEILRTYSEPYVGISNNTSGNKLLKTKKIDKRLVSHYLFLFFNKFTEYCADKSQPS